MPASNEPKLLASWLHISDIHSGMPSADAGLDRKQVLDELAADVARIEGDGIEKPASPDIAFLTGDIAFSGDDLSKGQEYQAASEIVAKILAACPGIRDNVFLVPGNHDVSRASLKRNVNLRRMVQLCRSGEENFDSVLSDAEECSVLHERFTEYLNFAKSINPSCAALWWKESFTVRGIKMAAYGLNTALLCCDDSDMGKILLGASQFQAMTNDPAVFTIVLTHHPLRGGWLHDEAGALAWLRKKSHVHLCGHVHDPDLHSMRLGASQHELVTVTAGAAHSGDGLVYAGHRYNVTSLLQMPDGTICLRVFNRSFSQKFKEFRPDGENSLSDRFYAELSTAYRVPPQPGVTPLVETARTLETGSDSEASLARRGGLDVNTPNAGDEVDPFVASNSADLSYRFPRVLARNLRSHAAVRSEEIDRFLNQISNCRQAWVLCEWGAGWEGFVLAALRRRDESERTNSVVYCLDVADVSDASTYPDVMCDQFGCTAIEFAQTVNRMAGVVLVISGVEAALDSTDGPSRVGRFIGVLLDYCEAMDVAVVSGRPHAAMDEFVELRALDLADLRQYVQLHESQPVEAMSTPAVTDMFGLCDGLPSVLDDILRTLQVATLDDIKSQYLLGEPDCAASGVSRGLARTIGCLDAYCVSTQNQRPMLLLQLLAFLPAGESLAELRHVIFDQPLFPPHASRLHDLGLIRTLRGRRLVGLSSTTRGSQSEEIRDVYLRANRNIREYVIGRMTPGQQENLLRVLADHYFGRNWHSQEYKWRANAIRLRASAWSEANESHIAARLVVRAKGKEPVQLRRATSAGIAFLRLLGRHSMFREALLASDELAKAIGDDMSTMEAATVNLIRLGNLRMVDGAEAALPGLRELVEVEYIRKDRRLLKECLLKLAHAEQHAGTENGAREASNRLLALKVDAATRAQAEYIIASIEPNRSTRIVRLRKLEADSRKRKYRTAADNAALTLAGLEERQERKISYLERVISGGDGEGSVYNLARAEIFRAEVLIASVGSRPTGPEILRLRRAYEYVHRLRTLTLFNRCHRCLWEMLKRVGDTRTLHWLFRESSLVWRLNGDDESEGRCLADLDTYATDMAPNAVTSDEERYLGKRIRMLIPAPRGHLLFVLELVGIRYRPIS